MNFLLLYLDFEIFVIFYTFMLIIDYGRTALF